MRLQYYSLKFSCITLALFLLANPVSSAPIIDLKSKAELKVTGLDQAGKPIKKNKPGIGKVKFEKKLGSKKDKVKKTTKFTFEKGRKLPKLKIAGTGKFDKKKLDKRLPFTKKKKIDILGKQNFANATAANVLASFEFPIEINLDLTRGGLISGFSFKDLGRVTGIPILQTEFLGLSAASIVPEPRVGALLGLGMFGLIWFAARPSQA